MNPDNVSPCERCMQMTNSELKMGGIICTKCRAIKKVITEMTKEEVERFTNEMD